MKLEIETMTDKEIFMELGRRGYECSDYRGSNKIATFFSQGTLVAKTKFYLYVPDGKYPLEES